MVARFRKNGVLFSFYLWENSTHDGYKNYITLACTGSDWEIYEGDHFHTDYCSWVDPDKVDLDKEMDLDWEVFSQEEYNNTILANSCESANFDDWYGDENAKVLCILIKA